MSDTTTDRVADAPADIWVYRLLPRWLWPYAQLARWDRPIGWWLLLWPCWWSLAMAFANVAEQMLDVETNQVYLFLYQEIFYAAVPTLFAFWLGAVMMRGAGCTYNDFVDVEIDAKVARTASRPIPSGRVTRRQSAVFMMLQALVGFVCLVLLCRPGQSYFNTFAFLLGIASLAVVAVYPFAKRVTDWPQLVLGLAFSWGALMGWAVVFGNLASAPILLYAGSVLWVIGYDTMYAHQDKEDDALIGVRSTARLFGENTKPALILLYSGTLILFAAAFYSASASWPAYLGLAMGCGHMIWQIRTLDINNPDNCLVLFKSNKTFGWIVFAGLVADIFV